MHDQRVVHGDLNKGVRFREQESLPNSNGDCQGQYPYRWNRPRPSSILATISDTASLGSSIHGSTFRWMSPELFYPEDFGLEDSHTFTDVRKIRSFMAKTFVLDVSCTASTLKRVAQIRRPRRAFNLREFYIK